VDGLGEVISATTDGESRLVTVRAPRELAPFFAEKGSVTINGVSLTVTAAGADSFTVALIPKTIKSTNLNELAKGSHVNVEVDLLARYVARLRSVEVAGAGGRAARPGRRFPRERRPS